MACAVLVFLAIGLHSHKQPDAQTIIERSVQANKADWAAFPKYEFDETDYDSGGHTRTYHVTMILGSPYERLIRINGKPLLPQQQASERQKFQHAVRSRRNETSEERARRVGSYERDRARDHLLMDQLADAFTFTVVGEQKRGLHDVYVLKATRRPGYNPPNHEAQVLTGMIGKLWIDEQTYQWVKVEAHVVQPVTIEGFLATVEPGTRFELEKMPVGNGIWLRKHFSMHSHAKILFFFSHNGHEEEMFSNYQLTHSDQMQQSH
ncbi:MAG: hypothetical protein ACRD5K_08855 [Candidatus Acidiferrales bacterium]